MAKVELLVFVCIILLCAGALLEPGSYEHHLLSVQNSSSGIGVSLTTLNGELFSETFSSLYLPPECGEDFSRCKDLLVDTNELDENVTQFVTIIPATRAVVILDIYHNGSALLLNNFYRVNQTIIDCNPTAVFKVGASYYTMCVKGMSYLTILELHLDPHSIQDAYFSQPAKERFRFGNDHELSNFLSVDLGSIFDSMDQSHQIVFVAQNWFYTYEPISAQTRYGPSIQCQPNKIEYAGEGEVLAYCNDRSLYINITNWQIKTTFYNDSGFPYLCPNYPRIQLSIFHSSSNVTFLKYRALQSGQTKEIPILGNGCTLYTNQCFGTRTAYFAYSTSDSIHIVDVISEINHTVSSHRCLGPWCLSVIGGQYLIVQEPTQGGTNISVLDAQQNLAPVVRMHGQQADLAALILTRNPTEPVTPTNSLVIAITVSLSVGTAVVLVVAVLCTMFRCRARRLPPPVPISVEEVGRVGEAEGRPLMERDSESADSSTDAASDDTARSRYAEPCTEFELGPNNNRKLVTGAIP